jgi:hypothetical protein
MNGLFPLVFSSEETYLLTAIGLGFMFGFSLERAGFANARKLAGQFYLHDMTVFKVMFTAILVAMTGFYILAGLGLVDVSRMWINRTFMWAQAIGGFLLGVGFIMSGLCPGTSVVSMASGRWDGAVTLGGIVIGTALFSVAIDFVPGLLRLYEAGGELSVLPALLGLPAPVVMLAVVAMAAGAFVGAEKVERKLRSRREAVELTPVAGPRAPHAKFALAGSLAGVVVVSLAFRPAGPEQAPVPMAAIEPLELAEAIIARDPLLLVLDMRADTLGRPIPGAVRVPDTSAARVIAATGRAVRVAVYDDTGSLSVVPAGWPAGFEYRHLRGGLAAWSSEVLAGPEATATDAESRAALERRRQIAAYFSGAGVSAPAAPPPPVAPAAGGGGKKRAGGC